MAAKLQWLLTHESYEQTEYTSLSHFLLLSSCCTARAAEVQITELPVGPEKKGPEQGEAFTLEPLEPEVRVEDFALQQPLVPEPTREPKKRVPRKRRTREPQAAAEQEKAGCNAGILRHQKNRRRKQNYRLHSLP